MVAPLGRPPRDPGLASVSSFNDTAGMLRFAFIVVACVIAGCGARSEFLIAPAPSPTIDAIAPLDASVDAPFDEPAPFRDVPLARDAPPPCTVRVLAGPSVLIDDAAGVARAFAYPRVVDRAGAFDALALEVTNATTGRGLLARRRVRVEGSRFVLSPTQLVAAASLEFAATAIGSELVTCYPVPEARRPTIVLEHTNGERYDPVSATATPTGSPAYGCMAVLPGSTATWVVFLMSESSLQRGVNVGRIDASGGWVGEAVEALRTPGVPGGASAANLGGVQIALVGNPEGGGGYPVEWFSETNPDAGRTRFLVGGWGSPTVPGIARYGTSTDVALAFPGTGAVGVVHSDGSTGMSSARIGADATSAHTPAIVPHRDGYIVALPSFAQETQAAGELAVQFVAGDGALGGVPVTVPIARNTSLRFTAVAGASHDGIVLLHWVGVDTAHPNGATFGLAVRCE